MGNIESHLTKETSSAPNEHPFDCSENGKFKYYSYTHNDAQKVRIPPSGFRVKIPQQSGFTRTLNTSLESTGLTVLYNLKTNNNTVNIKAGSAGGIMQVVYASGCCSD